MIATVKLYKSTKILDEKNFMVDFLTDYLATLSNTLTYTINYFKFDKKEPTLKLQLREENIEMLAGNDYNYLSITNQPTTTPNNTRTYYYFIINKIWKSENCVELQLKLDSLNTLKWNTDYVVSKRTKVLREHRNRFKNVTPINILANGSATISANSSYQGRYRGSVTLPPNPKLVGILNYNVDLYTNNSEDTLSYTLNNSTGELSIVLISDTSGSYLTHYKVYYSFPSVVARNVDAIPEGINPILYKGEENDIIQTELDTSWNLIYKNHDDPSPDNLVNPVECYACADTPLKVAAANSSRSISYSSLTDNKYYFIGASNNEGAELTFKDSANYEYNVKVYSYSGQGYSQSSTQFIILHKEAGNNYFSIEYKNYGTVSAPAPVGTKTIDQVIHTASNITSLEVISAVDEVIYAIGDTNTFSPYTNVNSGHFTFTRQDKYVNSLDGVDRTDSKLIKIFKLPYAPSKVTVSDNKFSLDENWDYDTTTSLFKLKNLNSKFRYEFDTPLEDPLMNLDGSIYPASSGIFPISALFAPRNIIYESKLYNSEFYAPKIVYDSFSFQFNLERVDIAKYTGKISSPYLRIGFVMTTTINSKFMFYFPNYELLDFLKTQDYDKYMPIARNNEVALYNSQYINYIRTGYNYDLKAKNRTQASSGLGLGLGITGSLASMGLGIASGNPAVMLGGIIGGISSIVSNVVSTINTISSSEMAIASKLEQLKNQATSIEGSDDIDLLEVYSNNKAKLCEWRCSDNMRKAIYDLFYYCGYATNEMKIPNLYSRMHFNFIQAELELNETNNLPDFVVNDLIERFKNGVTVMHMIENLDHVKIWDWNQEYENWEDIN